VFLPVGSLVLRNEKGDKGQTIHSVGQKSLHTSAVAEEKNSDTETDPFEEFHFFFVFPWRSFA